MGNSSSHTLFELVLWLRKLEMQGDLIIHVIHVAGTRMEAEDADGASRGDLSTGVMGGENILCYAPLHLSATELEPLIQYWIEDSLDKERGSLTWGTPEN